MGGNNRRKLLGFSGGSPKVFQVNIREFEGGRERQKVRGRRNKQSFEEVLC